MSSQIAIYVRNEPRREISLVAYNMAKSTKTDYTLSIVSTNKAEVEYNLLPHFDKNGWRFVNFCYGYLGNITLEGEIYLVLSLAKTKVTKAINKLSKVGFLSLSSERYDKYLLKDLDQDEYNEEKLDNSFYDEESDENFKLPFADLNTFLTSQHFYYSTSLDLTLNLKDTLSGEEVEPNFDFLYNQFMLKAQIAFLKTLAKDLQLYLLKSGLVTWLVQGYFNQFAERGDVTASLFSRVGWRRAGTRFHTRGIDDEGYVANFVETELRVETDTLLYSYIVLRGSVPLFWTQQGQQLLGHSLQFNRSLESGLAASEKHFKRLHQKYGKVVGLSLLGQKPGTDENTLNQKFQMVAHKVGGESQFRLAQFDYHAKVKGNQYYQAENFVSQLNHFDGFLYSKANRTVLTHQNATYRVNCLDCLDRTNIVQGMICTNAIRNLLQITSLDVASSQTYFQTQLNLEIERSGNIISLIYAGTQALQSGVATQGKANLLNKLMDASKSVNRLLQHHFLDSNKLETIYRVTGKNKFNWPVKLVNYNVNGSTTEEADTEFSLDKLTIHCGTFNVNGRVPSGKSLQEWLTPELGIGLPDVYALAFQEIVALTPSQILSADPERTQMWQQQLESDLYQLTINTDRSYLLVTLEQLVGICLFVFVDKSLLPHLSQVDQCVKKTGMYGMAGNKGAVSIRFNLASIPVCFVACHFASGQTKLNERNLDFHTVHAGLQFTKSHSLDEQSNVIYLGDFNYRIDMSLEACKLKAKQQKYSELYNHDQLSKSRANQLCFIGFEEGALTFPPTYKYDVGTDIYDTSEKMRIPAWTDRILYQPEQLNLIYYNHRLVYESDHRPVVAGFLVEAATEARKSSIKAAVNDWWLRGLIPIDEDEENQLDVLHALETKFYDPNISANPFLQPGLSAFLTQHGYPNNPGKKPLKTTQNPFVSLID